MDKKCAFVGFALCSTFFSVSSQASESLPTDQTIYWSSYNYFDHKNKKSFFMFDAEGLYVRNDSNMLVATHQKPNTAGGEVFRPDLGMGFKLFGLFHKSLYSPFITWSHYNKTSNGNDTNGSIFQNKNFSLQSKFDILDFGFYQRFKMIDWLIKDINFGLKFVRLGETWKESVSANSPLGGKQSRLADRAKETGLGTFFGMEFYQPIVSNLTAQLHFQVFAVNFKEEINTGISRIQGNDHIKQTLHQMVPGVDFGLGGMYVYPLSTGYIKAKLLWTKILYAKGFFNGASAGWNGVSFSLGLLQTL